MFAMTRPAITLLAALALLMPAAYAQTPSVPSTAPRTAPTMPAPTSPSVPAKIATGSPAPSMSVKKIDVNGASETELASLPGIGPVTAKAIVEGRPWDDLAELVKKKVMASSVLDRNRDKMALANINTSSAADMAKVLPGIGDKTAPKIVSGRPYATPQDLVTKKVLTAAQFAKVKDVVTY